MSLNKILESLDGNLSLITRNMFFCSEREKYAVQKRLSEALVRAILYNNQHFNLHLPGHEILGQGSHFCPHTGRVTLNRNKRAHRFSIIGYAVENSYNIPFFAEIYPTGNLKGIEENTKKAFQEAQEFFQRKDLKGIIFSDIRERSKKTQKKIRNKFENFEEETNPYVDPSKLEETEEQLIYPGRLKNALREHSPNLHYVDLGQFRKGHIDIERMF